MSSLKTERQQSHAKFLTETENSILQLKASSLEYRSWTTDLYSDFCDALFYSKFEECNRSYFKAITNNFDDLLTTFNIMQWDIVSGKKIIPNIPKDFNGISVTVEDNEASNPIKSIKQTG